ncbi:hypothetical protein BN14_10641 [Rhizoctonia solani AG-1 IB]|uniref:Uncharacterized protein n=1 Tax=Thanatephorus cucumeris (strain AG1-IB / isolate 7/3/14) TaxID=1108050 RepID=M5CB09_THACB|nr:hypothetical protein BN14_10641 [Rhizoctonia solani AG-1 IB]
MSPTLAIFSTKVRLKRVALPLWDGWTTAHALQALAQVPTIEEDMKSLRTCLGLTQTITGSTDLMTLGATNGEDENEDEHEGEGGPDDIFDLPGREEPPDQEELPFELQWED